MSAVRSDLIPLGLLRIGRAKHLKSGSYARVQELSGADLFVGMCGEFRVAVVFEQGIVWSKNADDLSGAALWVPDLEFEVDWDTFAVFDHIDNKLGALAIKAGTISLAAPPPSKAGYVLIELGQSEITEGEVAYGFTRWRAVARRGDERVILFEFGK